MPNIWTAVDQNFPTINTEGDPGEQLKKIVNYMYVLQEQLKYTLDNLDTKNFNDTALKEYSEETTAPLKETQQGMEQNLKDLNENNDEINKRLDSVVSTLNSFAGPDMGKMLDYFFPVGSLVPNTNPDFDPNTAWGGKWILKSGRVLIGAGDEFPLGLTGGSKDHTLTVDELPSHSHGTSQLSTDNATPSMTATLNRATANKFSGYMMRDKGSTSASGEYAASGSSSAKGFALDTDMNITVSGGEHNHSLSGDTDTAGNGQAFSTMMPYYAVNMWERIE